FSATNTTFGISNSFTYQLGSYFPFAEWLVAHQVFKLGNIFMRIIQDTLSFQTISSGPAGFLIIVFNTFRNVIMDNETNIGFVNTHSECNGSHNYLNLFTHKLVLAFGS